MGSSTAFLGYKINTWEHPTTYHRIATLLGVFIIKKKEAVCFKKCILGYMFQVKKIIFIIGRTSFQKRFKNYCQNCTPKENKEHIMY